MKKLLLLSVMFCSFVVLGPALAAADQQPEMIAEKMAIKFVRGVANSVTGVVEFPKQTYLSVKSMGALGVVVGPIKGIGMTFYRTLIGVVETVFCVVPQPGYYDPMMDPEYVWQGWEPRRDTTEAVEEVKGK